MAIESYVLVFLILVVVGIVVYGALNPERDKLKKHNEVHFKAEGIEVACLVCGNKKFKDKKVQMNTSLLSFLNMDWANRSATALECLNCGFVMWFSQDVKE